MANFLWSKSRIFDKISAYFIVKILKKKAAGKGGFLYLLQDSPEA